MSKDSSALEVGEKALDDGVPHHDDNKNDHDGAGDAADPAEYAGGGRGPDIHALQGVDDISGKGIKTLAIPGNSRGQAGLQRDGEFIKFHRHQGKAPHGHKALDGADSRVLDAGPSGLVFDSDLEHGHHQPDDIQRPGQIRKKENNGLYPAHLEELDAHVPHLGKKVAKETNKLAVDPVDKLIHQPAKEKVQYKHLVGSPLCVRGTVPALDAYSCSKAQGP